jgi:hypothetical protein
MPREHDGFCHYFVDLDWKSAMTYWHTIGQKFHIPVHCWCDIFLAFQLVRLKPNEFFQLLESLLRFIDATFKVTILTSWYFIQELADQPTIGCLLYDFASVCETRSKLIYDLMQILKQMWKVRNSKGLWYNLYTCILKDRYIMKTNFHLVFVGFWILIECVGVCNLVFVILRYVAATFNYVYKLVCFCNICNCKFVSNNSFVFITFIMQLSIYDGLC